MKKFEFHLDGLLRVKRQLEHIAELEQQAHIRVSWTLVLGSMG